MRSLSIHLSIMVLVAMLLAACSGNAPSTNAPVTSPIATNTISAPSVESLTPSVESTTTGPETETTPTASAGITAVVPVTGKPNASRLSEQLDFGVWNQNGEQVGEVDDIVLDLDNAMVAYVIVGTGGFLDLGEKQIAVPWDKLVVQESKFALQVDDDTLVNAPAMDMSILPQIGEPANDWDTQFRSYWAGSNASGAQPAPASPSATKLQGVVLASQILDADLNVQDQVNLQVEIEDLIVNTKSGKVQFVVIKTNLDNTERWIPVPLALFNWDNTSQAFNVKLDLSTLQAAFPALVNQFPDTTMEGWEQEWITFWQNQGVDITP